MHRWFQFSLRSFFLVMAAAGIWLGVYVDRARRQREAVATIKALGGTAIYRHDNAASPYEMRLPTWLVCFFGKDCFADVTYAGFMDETTIGPKGLGFIRDLPYLEELYLHNVTTSPADLEAIKSLKRLRHLSVNFQRVTITQVREIQTKLPRCEIRDVDYFLRSTKQPIGPNWEAIR